MEFTDKIAIVTGGAKGIGRAICVKLSGLGATVIVADIDDEAGEALAETLGAPGRADFVHCDVSKKLDVNNLVKTVVNSHGRIDVLANNAGIIHAADFLEFETDDFDRVLDVNLRGTFLMSQAVSKQMVQQVKDGGEAGSIVNMSSVTGFLAMGNQAAYSVSKAGIAQLTKVMSLSLAPYGIRVNAVGPGSIMTDMLATITDDKAARHAVLSRTPLGRIGDPMEIANIVAFLASNEASYMTGQTVFADGGRMGMNYTCPVVEEE